MRLSGSTSVAVVRYDRAPGAIIASEARRDAPLDAPLDDGDSIDARARSTCSTDASQRTRATMSVRSSNCSSVP